ncbi:hypothetical protein SAMN00017405_0958 [Desulfonispora thiosulfatigenes DSM 11270]|uniref:Uncharacterized protein n=1 Tax=Desulfonispora thiosulfatigenes DSM 11270 TaxID=656914 RepID=A0A1W1UPU0_DESTI|nr:hypothetical protein [Desulfonispora thiosulfatigenes]SMB82724.1 hypothetical protein SAMN00017405_0958 [Desulfonispora thiosulfatigenes DSM 11270]
MSNEGCFVSLYKICEELFEEKSQKEKEKSKEDFEEKSFQNYYNKQKSRFKEILTSLGIDINVLRKVEDDTFEIPVEKKKIVKKLLHNYTSKVMKKVRKKDFTGIPIKELKQIIGDVELIMDGKVDDGKYQLERNRMYFLTRYSVAKVISDIKEDLLKQIETDIEEMIPIVTEYTLNDEDKINLLRFYKMRLKEMHEEMKSIVQYVSDYRLDELFNISQEMIEQGIENDEAPDQRELSLDEGWGIILEALHTL